MSTNKKTVHSFYSENFSGELETGLNGFKTLTEIPENLLQVTFYQFS